MAIKEIKREWSPCQLDYVKTFLLHSEKELKDLPKCCIGSKAIVSETDNEYYCTESGWKLGSELGGGSEVVILPETELKPGAEYGSDGFVLTTPLANNFTVGKKYTFKWNGEEYTTKAADASALTGDGGFVFGNLDIVSGELSEMLGGTPDANAPFVCIYAPNGSQGVYLTFVASDEPTSVTLSIVEKAETASAGGGGGVLVINMSCDLSDDMTVVSNPTKDKTYAEAKAVYDAGGIVVVRLGYKSGPMLGMTRDFQLTGYMVFEGQEAFLWAGGASSEAGPNLINLLSDDSFNIMID